MYNFAHVYHCQIIIFVQCISFVQCTPFCNVYLLSNVYICPMWGTWIAEWYHTWLWSLVHCAMPWAVSLSLSDNKLFLGPKHIIYIYSWFYFVYLVWYYYLSVKFVMWIVKRKIENKRNLFKKIYLTNVHLCPMHVVVQCIGLTSENLCPIYTSDHHCLVRDFRTRSLEL